MPGKKRSLETSLYPLLISRLDGARIGEGPYKDRILNLIEKGISGFILFGGQKDEVKSFICKMQARAETPLFMAADIERRVDQHVPGMLFSPARCQLPQLLRKTARMICCCFPMPSKLLQRGQRCRARYAPHSGPGCQSGP